MGHLATLTATTKNIWRSELQRANHGIFAEVICNFVLVTLQSLAVSIAVKLIHLVISNIRPHPDCSWQSNFILQWQPMIDISVSKKTNDSYPT
jgi:hypothetical protein